MPDFFVNLIIILSIFLIITLGMLMLVKIVLPPDQGRRKLKLIESTYKANLKSGIDIEQLTVLNDEKENPYIAAIKPKQRSVQN